MAFDFHNNRSKYFKIQWQNSAETIFPLIEQYMEITPETKVFEIGCRDGGVLMPFYERGCFITGLDLVEYPLVQARQNYELFRSNFICEDIHTYITSNREEKFDVIILKDTLEHIPDQGRLISNLKNILSEKGIIYFGFPPWQNPYGGHQQVCKNKLCALMPYYHLLPNFIYYNILKVFSPHDFNWLKITKDTRITPEKFECFVRCAGLEVLYRQFYLISPAYRHKFNLKPRKQFSWLASIPYLRNFFTTTCDYVIRFPARGSSYASTPPLKHPFRPSQNKLWS